MSHGMWNLPACTYYLHRDRMARAAPIGLRVNRALSGIRKSIRERSLFHMYFHPFNIATDPRGLIAGLRSIFRYVYEKREAGELVNWTMGQLADRLSGVPGAAVVST